MMYDFEKRLSEFCGSPFAIAVDCCTHAIELCLRHLNIKKVTSTAFTYLSVPMTMKLLNINHTMTNEQWRDEYKLHCTPVWDSARCLKPNMYRPNSFQCLSFGPSKPLDNTRGGAILLDNEDDFIKIKTMSYDGRHPQVAKWIEQPVYTQGFHYMMRWEEMNSALNKLEDYIERGVFEHQYPDYYDCRNINIT